MDYSQTSLINFMRKCWIPKILSKWQYFPDKWHRKSFVWNVITSMYNIQYHDKIGHPSLREKGTKIVPIWSNILPQFYKEKLVPKISSKQHYISKFDTSAKPPLVTRHTDWQDCFCNAVMPCYQTVLYSIFYGLHTNAKCNRFPETMKLTRELITMLTFWEVSSSQFAIE